MVELFARYASGVQMPAGPIVGSGAGVSGLNPIVDRVNSITSNDSFIIADNTKNVFKETITNFDIGDNLTISTIILDQQSGTNVDYVTTNLRDSFEIEVTAYVRSQGSSAISFAYSGAGGNNYQTEPMYIFSDGTSSSGTYANLENAVGIYNHKLNPVSFNLGVGTESSLAVTTLSSSGNVISQATSVHSGNFVSEGDLIGSRIGSIFINTFSSENNNLITIKSMSTGII